MIGESYRSGKKYRQAGFTLVELVVAMGLLVLLMAGVFGLLQISLSSWLQGSSKTEVQQVARQALDSMAREIQYASSITRNSASSITFTTVQAGVSKNINYYLDTTANPQIIYRNDGTGARPLTGGSNIPVSISALNFTLFPPDPTLPKRAVEIKLTAVDLNRPANQVQLETAVTAMNIP
jgi:prepilin-type N-terminal cleavage/methylation domain-containing protein